MPPISGAEALVASLRAENVTQLFGYAGATICPIAEVLAKTPGIAYTLVRTEQNAGHMASGYYRESGNIGVCMVTSGPGATNLITGIATAYMDSIPMIAITGQVPSHLLGRDIFQEVDISGAVAPFSKHTYLIKDHTQIPRIVREAIHIATTGRPGPVLLDIPVDVQTQMLDSFEYPEEVNIRGYRPSVRGNPQQVKKVVAAMQAAKSPLICAGGGVVLANAQDQLKTLAQDGRFPVVTTMMGLSLLPTSHPLHLGMVGSHGTAVANRALHETDLLILIGARAADRAIVRPEEVDRQTDIIHIDVDPAEIGKNMRPAVPLVGSIAEILKQINELTPKSYYNEHHEGLTALQTSRREERKKPFENPTKKVHPPTFLRELGEKLDSQATVCVDVGQNQLWTCKHLALKEGTRLLTSGGLGTMGYALPCAIGVKVAEPHRQTVVICGDGSFQMSMNELSAVVAGKMDLKIIIFQNNVLGLVHQIQTTSYTQPYGVALDGSPDFEKIAGAYGIAVTTITKDEEITEGINTLFNTIGSAILIVQVDKRLHTTD